MRIARSWLACTALIMSMIACGTASTPYIGMISDTRSVWIAGAPRIASMGNTVVVPLSHGTLIWDSRGGARQISCITWHTAHLSRRDDAIFSGLERCPLDGTIPTRLLPVDLDGVASIVDGIVLATSTEQAWLVTDDGAQQIEVTDTGSTELVAVSRDARYAALELETSSRSAIDGTTTIGVVDLADGRRVSTFGIPSRDDTLVDGTWLGPFLLLLGRETLWIVLEAATNPTVHSVDAGAGVRAAQDPTHGTVLLVDVGRMVLIDGATANEITSIANSAIWHPRVVAPSSDGYVVLTCDGVMWYRPLMSPPIDTIVGDDCAIDVHESTGTAACCHRRPDGDDTLLVYERGGLVPLELSLPSNTCTSRTEIEVRGTRIAIASERRVVVADLETPIVTLHDVEVGGRGVAEFTYHADTIPRGALHAD